MEQSSGGSNPPFRTKHVAVTDESKACDRNLRLCPNLTLARPRRFYLHVPERKRPFVGEFLDPLVVGPIRLRALRLDRAQNRSVTACADCRAP